MTAPSLIREIQVPNLKKVHISNDINKIKCWVKRHLNTIAQNLKETEIGRKKDQESFLKILPNLSLPNLDEPRGALLWFNKVKSLTLKLSSGSCSSEMESRFTQVIRSSIKIAADNKAIVPMLTLDEIVSYVKSQYLDSGAVIVSCFKQILNSHRPRTVAECIRI